MQFCCLQNLWYYERLRLPLCKLATSPFGLYAASLQLSLCKVGSLQFRTTLSIHVASSTPRDSSMVLSKFFPSSMVFAHNTKARLPFFPLYTRVLFDDAAEFTLCYDLYFRSPCFLDRYFILPLSTPHYCDAPGLANGLLGNYPYRTCTGKCGPASLDAHINKSTLNILLFKVL